MGRWSWKCLPTQVAPAEEFRRPDNVMLSEFSDMREGLSAAGKNEAEKRTAKVRRDAWVDGC